MKAKCFYATDPGTYREENQDYFVCDEELGLYIICDGMGGHKAGRLAAEVAAKSAQDFIIQHKNNSSLSHKDLVEQAISFACHSVYERAQKDADCRGMGTTLSLIYLIGSDAVIGHVGDSRIYLYRDENLQLLTEDHTLVQNLVNQGSLTFEQAKKSPYRHVLDRAVGTHMSVQVDAFQFQLLPGDKIFLCTDGVSDLFDEGSSLAKYFRGDSEGIVSKTISEAMDLGSQDNATAILVEIHGEEQTLEEKSRIRTVKLTYQVLRQMYLFPDLTPTELVLVVERCEVLTAKAGDTIIQEGEKGDSLYIILDGFVEVTQEGKKLSALGSGNHVGDIALLLGLTRSATVIALNDTELLHLSHKEFDSLLQQYPKIGIKLLSAISKELAMRLKVTNATVHFLRGYSAKS